MLDFFRLIKSGPRPCKHNKGFKHFARDEEGVAAIEFAMIATMLGVTLLLGGWEVATATMIKKRVDANTQMITDLVAQETVYNESLFRSYEDFLARNIHPFKPASHKAPIKVHIIGVRVDSLRRVRIDWQYPRSGSNLVSTQDLPNALLIPDTFYVISGLQYTYNSMFGIDFIGDMTFSDTAIMTPRNSLTIAAR